jgi:hypothetical protein
MVFFFPLCTQRGVDGELGKGGQAVVKSMTIKDEDGTVKKVALKVFKVSLSLCLPSPFLAIL